MPAACVTMLLLVVVAICSCNSFSEMERAMEAAWEPPAPCLYKFSDGPFDLTLDDIFFVKSGIQICTLCIAQF